ILHALPDIKKREDMVQLWLVSQLPPSPSAASSTALPSSAGTPLSARPPSVLPSPPAPSSSSASFSRFSSPPARPLCNPESSPTPPTSPLTHVASLLSENKKPVICPSLPVIKTPGAGKVAVIDLDAEDATDTFITHLTTLSCFSPVCEGRPVIKFYDKTKGHPKKPRPEHRNDCFMGCSKWKKWDPDYAHLFTNIPIDVDMGRLRNAITPYKGTAARSSFTRKPSIPSSSAPKPSTSVASARYSPYPSSAPADMIPERTKKGKKRSENLHERLDQLSDKLDEIFLFLQNKEQYE
ncbi:hypothetical protein BT69DRAFT_1291313, partial [Atractiella rhizophila]